ncbi:MAG: hypothetical protein ACFFED_14035 [Candidatus Thorarchaeota archaeon]
MRLNRGHRSVVLLLITLFLINPSFATAHTFEWGVEVGDEFTYALQRKVLDSAYISIIPFWMNFIIPIDAGTKFIATITELEVIPADITLSDDLPLSHASLTLENDSSNLLTDSTVIAILINDWEFQGEFLNFSLESPDMTVTDTDTEWGLAEDSSFSFGGRLYSYHYEWRYEKTQGTLVYSRYRVTTMGTDVIDIILSQWEEGDPTILPPELQLTTILMLAVGGSIGVIVAFLAYRWVRTPKGLAAELGR